ncbi:MAG: hypothetical protein LBP75_10640 [Planctomycetota bacterium]|jgi:Na+/H+ antiporter NhaB|nr:hypothetical protein [Planctomycetota bacterium]
MRGIKICLFIAFPVLFALVANFSGAFSAMVVLSGACVAFYVIYKLDRAAVIQRKKETYEAALQGNDKQLALVAGRAYYAEFRGGKRLTIYDESAIANDISTMKG